MINYKIEAMKKKYHWFGWKRCIVCNNWFPFRHPEKVRRNASKCILPLRWHYSHTCSKKCSNTYRGFKNTSSNRRGNNPIYFKVVNQNRKV